MDKASLLCAWRPLTEEEQPNAAETPVLALGMGCGERSLKRVQLRADRETDRALSCA